MDERLLSCVVAFGFVSSCRRGVTIYPYAIGLQLLLIW